VRLGPRSRSTEIIPAALAEVERRIAWLRLLAIPLIVAAETLPHPREERTDFLVGVAVVSVYAVGMLVWVYTRQVTPAFGIFGTAADVAAITALVALSGGAYSQARLTYFLVPVAVAFRFRPGLTALASSATVIAYVLQAVAHPAHTRPQAARFIAVQAGYLLWIGLAAVLLSVVLEQRTRRVAELAARRQGLIVEALSAGERERRALAEGLHDHAIQNLLSARHDLEEATDGNVNEALARADAAVEATIADLREAVFELHPYVLEQSGLEAALRAAGQRAARRGGFRIHYRLSSPRHHPQEVLVFAAARELLTNAAAHASASNVEVALQERNGSIELAVRDDGCGFDPGLLPQRIAEGHIGLQSQRERVESAGGRFEIRSEPGRGTAVEIQLPNRSLGAD
jgi:two-component system, NarL family, sensor kinase